MKLHANGIDIEFESFGDERAPAILLIMGLGAQLVLWPEEFCERLAAGGFRVIRFDNRDVGLSTKIEGRRHPRLMHHAIASVFGVKLPVPYTLDDMAHDALGVLDALKIPQAHVVGASMGGMIAQILAAKYPQRVSTLTAIMTTTGNRKLPQARLELQMRLVRRPKSTDRETLVRHSMQTFRLIGSPQYPMGEALLRAKCERSYDRSSYRAGMARQTMAIIASGSRVKLVRNIKAPTLIIHGQDDPLVPVAGAHDLAKHIPGSRLEVIPGMGHDLPPALLPRMADSILRHVGPASAQRAA